MYEINELFELKLEANTVRIERTLQNIVCGIRKTLVANILIEIRKVRKLNGMVCLFVRWSVGVVGPARLREARHDWTSALFFLKLIIISHPAGPSLFRILQQKQLSLSKHSLKTKRGDLKTRTPARIFFKKYLNTGCLRFNMLRGRMGRT